MGNMIIIINRDIYYMLISLLSTTARRGNPSLMTRWENRKATMVRNRHKKVTCGKCLRIMRSDTLKRHMKQHEKERFEKEVYSSASIRSSASQQHKLGASQQHKQCKVCYLWSGPFATACTHCNAPWS